MPLEDLNAPRLSTFFYISEFKSEGEPIRGHYRLDLNVLSSNWREYKPHVESEEDGITSRPPFFIAYFEEKNENDSKNIKRLPFPLLHYIGRQAYPQWVFSSLMKIPILKDVGNSKFELRVNNVEQGSWNEIRKDGKSYLMFDIGTNAYNWDCRGDINRQLRNHPIKDDVEALFISHWHADHFNILLGMNLSEHNHIKQLICPSWVMSLSAFNIIWWYKVSGRSISTVFHPYDTNWKKYQINDRINLYARRYVKTNFNNAGLLMYFDGPLNSVTLPGDANYSTVQGVTNDGILQFKSSGGYYMVVPHHGGNAGSFTCNINPSVNKLEAIISVGANNPYHHPYKKVVSNLGNCFKSVIQTKISGTVIKGL